MYQPYSTGDGEPLVETVGVCLFDARDATRQTMVDNTRVHFGVPLIALCRLLRQAGIAVP